MEAIEEMFAEIHKEWPGSNPISNILEIMKPEDIEKFERK